MTTNKQLSLRSDVRCVDCIAVNIETVKIVAILPGQIANIHIDLPYTRPVSAGHSATIESIDVYYVGVGFTNGDFGPTQPIVSRIVCNTGAVPVITQIAATATNFSLAQSNIQVGTLTINSPITDSLQPTTLIYYTVDFTVQNTGPASVGKFEFIVLGGDINVTET
jgi:hypothetical protein